MGQKLKPRSLFLIAWIGSIIIAGIIASAGSAMFPEGTTGYTVVSVFTLIAVISFVYYLIKWKNTCPSCKEGKMNLVGYEDGETSLRTDNVVKTDKVKDSKGNLVLTIERKEKESSLVTPKYKIYRCDHCGHEIQKLASVKRS